MEMTMSNPRKREGVAHVIPVSHRRTLERDRSTSAHGSPQAKGGPASRARSEVSDGNPLRTQVRNPLERSARRVRVRQRLDLLAPLGLVDLAGDLVRIAPAAAQRPRTPGRNRLVSRGGRQCLDAGGFWGVHTGINPTDRAKRGCKRHLVTDANGIPLVVQIGPANVHDSVPTLELLDSIPEIQGPLGRPRSRPDIFQGDRAYGTPDVLAGVRDRGVKPLIPKINSKIHGSGLGKFRFVVERTLAWFGQKRRLKICYEKTGDHFQALHDLTAAFICANKLVSLREVLH